jgi:hypothetical protein
MSVTSVGSAVRGQRVGRWRRHQFDRAQHRATELGCRCLSVPTTGVRAAGDDLTRARRAAACRSHSACEARRIHRHTAGASGSCGAPPCRFVSAVKLKLFNYWRWSRRWPRVAVAAEHRYRYSSTLLQVRVIRVPPPAPTPRTPSSTTTPTRRRSSSSSNSSNSSNSSSGGSSSSSSGVPDDGREAWRPSGASRGALHEQGRYWQWQRRQRAVQAREAQRPRSRERERECRRTGAEASEAAAARGGGCRRGRWWKT